MTRLTASRRRLLGSLFATAALAACGGGGGDAGSPLPPPPPPGPPGPPGPPAPPPPPPPSGASGRVIVESTQGLIVFDVAARTRRVFAVLPSNLQTGVTASAAGLIADQNGYSGPNTPWRVSLRSVADGSTVSTFEVNRSSSLPIAAAAISNDGARLAVALSEPGAVGGFVDRLLVVERASGATTLVTPAADAVWLGNGELLVRVSDRVRVLNAALANLGELPFTVTTRDAAASGSPDGRIIVYENNGQIRAYDRISGNNWLAATSTRTLYAPVISPDGGSLAMLRGAASSGLFVHVVPFAAGVTSTVQDSDSLRSAAGESVPGDERFAWIPS